MLSRIRAIEKALTRPEAFDDAALRAGVLQHWPDFLPHPTDHLLAVNVAAARARLGEGFTGDEIYTPHIVSRATALALMALIDATRHDKTRNNTA